MSSSATNSTAAPQPTNTASAPSDTTSPSSNPFASPSATIVPTHFPHKTLNAAPIHPFLDTATPALNTVPIELDSTPLTSPVAGQSQWKAAAVPPDALEGKPAESAAVGGKKIERLSGLRQKDPAVLPGPPGTPGPEDFEVVMDQERGGKEAS